MPRPLPGLRWDHDRQRYFPCTHTVAAVAAAVDSPQTTEPPRRLLAPHRALSDLRSVWCTAHKDALVHRIQASQISLTDKTARYTIPVQGFVSAFQIASHAGHPCTFVGDTLGWFYSANDDVWQPQYHLSSEVSSIALSPTACVATSFGPEPRILYLPLDSPAQGLHISRIDSRIVHDVWTTDLLRSRLVLGANKQAVLIEDIAVSTSLRRLATQSDVFALAQCENVLYTGLRNGAVIRFDTRIHRPPSYPLFGRTSDSTSSVTALGLLHDHRLLAGFLDGAISTFDLRFLIQTPLASFTGNVNSYTTRLPLVTDPHEKFLFAAGQDNKIRIWSLTTGGPPLDTGTGSTHQTAFECPFEHRVAALQVVQEREGMCLWAASGTELCKYSLGHRSGIGGQDRSG